MIDFSSTHWSQIRQARSPQASHYEQAWQYLLARYRPVIDWFFERHAPNQDLAIEWTAAFIAAWVGGKLNGADPTKGRFRGYLFSSLKTFSTDQFRKLVLRQTVGSESLRGLRDDKVCNPADCYELDYTRVVVTRALDRLRQFEEQRQLQGLSVRWYSLLREYYIEPDSSAERPGQRELGERYQLTAKAVELQLANARNQLRRWIEADLRQTVSSQDELNQEIDLLIRNSPGLFGDISDPDQS